MWGDPRQIGRLHIRAETCDLEAARAASKAFREPRVHPATGPSDSTHGLLFHALQARGDVLREHGAGAFVIRCPNHQAHTSGRIGDGSTLLYRPAAGEHVGAIHCLHGHCIELSVREWLRFFERHEIDAAERAANRGKAA